MSTLHRAPRRAALAAALAAALTAALTCASARAEDDCLKQVFGAYCLGGPPPDGVALPGEPGAPITLPGAIALELLEGRVIAVARQLRPASWVDFMRWKADLVRLYGGAEDISDFPPYAASSSSRLNAIRAGRGSAGARWRREGWRVELHWRRTDAMELVYRLDNGAGPALDLDAL